VPTPVSRVRNRALHRGGRPLAWALLWLATAVALRAQGALDAAAPVGFPLQPGIWRLDGTDPALPHHDLEPLRTIVGKATVVGLGESIHTSGGYYEAKHRIFRYLVEKLGFRVIAFETPWLDGETANAYVQTCDGTADAATAGFFGVWRSSELSALVRWMCEWNSSHPSPKDKLSVYAFDVQWQAAEDAQALADFLARVGVDPTLEPYAGLERCRAAEAIFRPRGTVSEVEIAPCADSTDAVAAYFASHARTLPRLVGKVDFAWAKLRLAGLAAWVEEMRWYGRDFPRSFAARDRGMATLFQGIRALRHAKSKIALWAHNGHITQDANAYGLTTMGSFLAQELKGKYATVGLVSHRAAIDWPGVGCGAVEIPGPGSVEEILHDLGEPALLVDLRFPGASEPPIAPGQVYELNSTPMVPARAFNALVFLDRSRKMTPVAWVPCQ